MAEEVKQEEVTLTPQEQVDQLKANSVSKEQFDTLQQQYNKLFEAYTQRPSNNEEQKELTIEEQKEADDKKFQDNCKVFQDGYSGNRHTYKSDYDITKAILEADDYFRKYKGKSVLESQTGNSAEEADTANRAIELAKYAMEQSQGDPTVFSTLFNKHLI